MASAIRNAAADNTAVAAVIALAIAAIICTATWGAWRTASRAARSARHALDGTPASVVVAAVAAVACTAYTADTSWRFAAQYLDMGSTAERAAMFAAAELALFACALLARQHIRQTATDDQPGRAGTPGLLVWVITGVQVIPAFAVSGTVGGIVRAFVGPFMAALLWHLAMGIEIRHARPGALRYGLLATIARELRERLLSWLGLATRDRSAEQITRDRWTVRAVTYAARLADTPLGGGWWTTRRRSRLASRLSVAVGRAQVGAEPEQRRMLLELLAARRHAATLATVTLPSPWQADTAPDSAAAELPPADSGTGDTRHDAPPPPDTADSSDEQRPPEPPQAPATYDSPVDRAIRPLYDTGCRPTTGQMTAAMSAAGLKPVSSTARQSRQRIERTEPHLAALPSALHARTGS
jgi:hypothetical protein